MATVLIHPNWHVVLLHLPLGLLSMGVLIELFGFLWKRSSARTAGRWMILLGALSAIPAATTGIYAFADAARSASSQPAGEWTDLVNASRWSAEQWLLMRNHIWLMASATVLALGATVTWVGASDRWRTKLHWPILATLLIALAAAAVGGWCSGEAVYQYGVAVTPQPESTPATSPAHAHGHEEAASLQYVDPLQTHLLLVGLTIAAAIGALAMTIRRWSDLAELEPADLPLAARPPALEIPASGPEGQPLSSPAPSPATPLFPARFWLIAGILALLVALAGLVAAEGLDWQLPELREVITKATSAEGRASLDIEQNRLLIHVILGACIIVLPLILAALTRFARRLKWITLIGIAMLLTAVGLQVWIGVSLLFSL